MTFSVKLVVFKLTPSKLQNSRSHSNIADHQTSSPKLVCFFSFVQTCNTVTSHCTQPSVGPWTSGDSSSIDHNHRNFTRGQYSTQSMSISQDLTIPPPQIHSYSTTTNILPSGPNFGSWNKPPTLHSNQYHNPALGGASIGYSSFPALGSGYSSQLTSQV
jgi:hypothetical protein